MDASNATRFLKSYNDIEECLRERYHVKASQSFTDLVNRCSDFDLTVRRYRNDLIDYGKLRNAIVHKAKGEKIIAYPCDEVVEQIEYIEKEICTPPVIVEILKPKKLVFVCADTPLKEAILLIVRTKHSSLPVYDGDKVVGVLNSHHILKHIGNALEAEEDIDEFLNKTPCLSVIDGEDIGKDYKFLPKTTTIFETFRAFEVGKKTLAVFFTETGAFGEKIINMLTPSDLPLLNKFIETFQQFNKNY